MSCSIYHKDSIHQDELTVMQSRHPQPANHDQLHYVFASQYTGDDRTSAPIDIDALGLGGDELAWAVAKILASDDNAVLHLGVYTADALYHHPAWRIWCASYDGESVGDGRAQFESDWRYIEQIIATAIPEASASWPAYSESMTYEQGRAIVLAAIQANVGVG